MVINGQLIIEEYLNGYSAKKPHDLRSVTKNILLISKKWIEESTTPKTKITGIDYGYLWWDIPLKVNGKTVISKTATGNGGQYIMVIPEMDMVAIFTGGAYNSQEDKLAFAIMNRVLLPTFNNEK